MPTINNIRVGTASATNGSAPTPGLPSGLASGDIMILAFYSREATDGTFSLPGTWTQLVNTRTTGGLLAVYYRVWQSGDTAPTITLGGHATGTSGDTAIAQIMAYSGGNTASPWDLVGTVSTNASQQNIGAIASAGVMGAEDMVLVIGGKRDDWTSVATLSGDGLTWNELGEPDSTSGADAGLVWNYALNPGSFLSLTSKTFTVTGGAAATGMGVMICMNVSPNFGTSATTMAAFTSSASGSAVVNPTGTVATTLSAFTSSASGTETIIGTSSQTLASAISSASGNVLSGMTGTAAVTLADATSAASGLENFTGTATPTLAAFTSTATGLETISGSASRTIDSFSSTAQGLETFAGSSAQTLSNFTGSAQGLETFTGSASETLDSFTSAATGIETITGSSSNVIDLFTSNAQGVETIQGQSAQVVDLFTSQASGVQVQPVTGSVSANIADFTSNATGIGGESRVQYGGSIYRLKNGFLIDLATGDRIKIKDETDFVLEHGGQRFFRKVGNGFYEY